MAEECRVSTKCTIWLCCRLPRVFIAIASEDCLTYDIG